MSPDSHLISFQAEGLRILIDEYAIEYHENYLERLAGLP
jgi:hypothetical protein